MQTSLPRLTRLPTTPTRRRASSLGVLAHLPSLTASVVPGIVFGAGILALRGRERFAWLAELSQYPWEMWTISTAGLVATLAGIGDWIYHRVAGVAIGKNERKSELIALAGGGVPLFGLMSAATLSSAPGPFLIPVFLVFTFTVVAI